MHRKKLIVFLITSCYASIMRVLVILLIFAIGFSGFSAAAHAFDSQKCAQGVSLEKNMSSMDDCHDGAANKDDNSGTKDGKHLCLTCGHCCVSHVAMPAMGLMMSDTVVSLSYTAVDTSLDGDILSGFERPPKSLV